MNPTLTDADPATAAPPAGSLLDEPTFEECCAEWLRYDQARKDGMNIDPDGTHHREYVAYYDGRIVGYGKDYLELKQRVAAELGVHPARPVIDYPWMWPEDIALATD
jgi:hypothetical protein